ncbi:MAG TPA: helix-turn-helix transcriptional regulator [Ktedonobacteraceae bacterium]|nr:helix-turn-helix transcriptional regulator [Ktedonobacteraceae bacterium]
MSPDSSHSQMGQSVGAKLRAARLARRYTQSQLAAPDFSVSYISAIERGQIHPSLRALEILARRLDLNSTQLLPDRSQNENGLGSPSLARDGDEIDLVLIEGQIAILQGNAQQTIVRLQRIPHKGLKPEQQLRLRLLLGWAYLLTDQLPKSEQSLLEVEKQAREQQHTPSLLHALHLLGQVYTAMYNHEQARQAYERCLTEMEQALPHDPFIQSQVYNLLGQEYVHLEQIETAIEKFEQAIAIAEELTNVTYLQTVYQDICTHYADVQEYLLATIYAYKCLHLQRQNILPLKSEIYHNLGRAMMKKNQEEALLYLEQTLKQESILQDTLTQASLTARMGEWYLLHKQLDQAEEFVQQARDLAVLAGDSIIAVEALLLLGRITYTRSQYDQSDTHFVQGLDMLERLSIPDELSEQSALYAQLLEERGKEREALTWYRRAFESRRRINNPLRD